MRLGGGGGGGMHDREAMPPKFVHMSRVCAVLLCATNNTYGRTEDLDRSKLLSAHRHPQLLRDLYCIASVGSLRSVRHPSLKVQ